MGGPAYQGHSNISSHLEAKTLLGFLYLSMLQWEQDNKRAFVLTEECVSKPGVECNGSALDFSAQSAHL